MKTSSPIHVGAVLFEGFELLDLFGPLELFGLLESDVKITVMAEKAGPVRSSSGPCAMAEATMADSQGLDVLLVPGGIGTRKEIANPPFLAELKRLAEASRIVAPCALEASCWRRQAYWTGSKRHRTSEYFNW